jgi:hypothetical protein
MLRSFPRAVQRSAAIAGAAFPLPTALGAQGAAPMPPIYRGVPAAKTGTVEGRVLDVRTGAPVVGARVAARWPARQGREPTNATGHFRLDFVEPGRVTLDVNCPSRTGLGPRLVSVPARVDTGRTTAVVLRGDPAACAEPDSATRPVTLRGVYTAGFEESRFIPCEAAGPAIAALWRPVHLRHAWVAAPGRSSRGPGWPAPDTTSGRYPRWYVVWRGTLTGPGRYGHMSVAPYLLRVTQIDTVRAAVPADCRPLPQPSYF